MRDFVLSEECGVGLPIAKALSSVWETGEDRLRIMSSLTPLKIFTGWPMLSQLGKSLIL